MFLAGPRSPHVLWLLFWGALGIGLGWYVKSAWPPALVALALAIDSVRMHGVAERDFALLRRLTFPPTPVTMVYTFTLRVTDRAWDALNVTPEERAALDACLTRPAGFIAEQWGQSFTRWRILTLNGQPAERVEDHYPGDRTIAGYPSDSVIQLWHDTPVEFRFEGALDRLLFFVWEKNPLSVMPDFTVHNPNRVLFELRLPLQTMQPSARRARCSELEKFFVKSEPVGEGAYYRRAGRDLYECRDDEKGFSWALMIHDLRPQLTARVTRVHRTLWTRQLTGLTVRLDETGQRIWANPLVVEQDDDGRALPMRGETVSLVLDGDFAVDRIWLYRFAPHNVTGKPK